MVPRVETQIVDRHVPRVEVQTVERIVEVPQIQKVQKFVDKYVEKTQEQIVEVPKIEYVERIVEVPQIHEREAVACGCPADCLRVFEDEIDFGAGPPLAFDHGAIAPVVCVFVRRPQNDGVNVYVSLPKHLLGTFSECVFVNETASVLVEE